jgi:hypothetical protein
MPVITTIIITMANICGSSANAAAGRTIIPKVE